MAMADKDSARPDFNPKHRIVGAIVLVALVVLVVPRFFDKREPPPELQGNQELSAPGVDTETRVVVTPVTEDTAPKQSSAMSAKVETPPAISSGAPSAEIKPAEKAPIEKAEVVKNPPPAPAGKEPVVVKKAETAPTKTQAAKPVSAVDKKVKGWVVQVGIFSNSENANHLSDNLKRNGQQAYTESVMHAGKKVVRVRVGPFRDKEQAVKAQAQIQQESGVKGTVQLIRDGHE